MARRAHALRAWPVFGARIRRPARLLVLCDLDGTIIPLQLSPALARAGPRERAVLRAVHRDPGVRLGPVSGRSLRSLRRAVGVPGLIYVGNHGLELGLRGRAWVVPDAKPSAPAITRLGQELASEVRAVPGAFVERKGYSLSVHWRGVAPGSVRRFHRLVHRVLDPWRESGIVRVSLGKRVIEARPPIAWDKGSAMTWLLDRYKYRKGEVLYLGDDLTDEDVFQVVNCWKGLSVYVGPPSRRTAARWRLDDPEQVLVMLTQVAEDRWNSRQPQ